MGFSRGNRFQPELQQVVRRKSVARTCVVAQPAAVGEAKCPQKAGFPAGDRELIRHRSTDRSKSRILRHDQRPAEVGDIFSAVECGNAACRKIEMDFDPVSGMPAAFQTAVAARSHRLRFSTEKERGTGLPPCGDSQVEREGFRSLQLQGQRYVSVRGVLSPHLQMYALTGRGFRRGGHGLEKRDGRPVHSTPRTAPSGQALPAPVPDSSRDGRKGCRIPAASDRRREFWKRERPEVSDSDGSSWNRPAPCRRAMRCRRRVRVRRPRSIRRRVAGGCRRIASS